MAAGTQPRGRQKAGSVAAASFTGTPRKATITFATAFPDGNYRVAAIGQDGRVWSVDAGRTASSFVLNSNSNTALTGPVDWIAIYDGETL